MDKFGSYDLNPAHKLRYFPEDTSLPKILNRVRKFLKSNDVEIVDINFSTTYSEDEEDLVFSAVLTYFGEVTND